MDIADHHTLEPPIHKFYDSFPHFMRMFLVLVFVFTSYKITAVIGIVLAYISFECLLNNFQNSISSQLPKNIRKKPFLITETDQCLIRGELIPDFSARPFPESLRPCLLIFHNSNPQGNLCGNKLIGIFESVCQTSRLFDHKFTKLHHVVHIIDENETTTKIARLFRNNQIQHQSIICLDTEIFSQYARLSRFLPRIVGHCYYHCVFFVHKTGNVEFIDVTPSSAQNRISTKLS